MIIPNLQVLGVKHWAYVIRYASRYIGHDTIRITIHRSPYDSITIQRIRSDTHHNTIRISIYRSRYNMHHDMHIYIKSHWNFLRNIEEQVQKKQLAGDKFAAGIFWSELEALISTHFAIFDWQQRLGAIKWLVGNLFGKCIISYQYRNTESMFPVSYPCTDVSFHLQQVHEHSFPVIALVHTAGIESTTAEKEAKWAMRCLWHSQSHMPSWTMSKGAWLTISRWSAAATTSTSWEIVSIMSWRWQQHQSAALTYTDLSQCITWTYRQLVLTLPQFTEFVCIPNENTTLKQVTKHWHNLSISPVLHCCSETKADINKLMVTATYQTIFRLTYKKNQT